MTRPTQPPDDGRIIVEDETLRAGFTQIPNAILGRQDLSPGAKLAYMGLLSFAWQTDSCFPGQDKLADHLGVGKRSIIRYLQDLQDAGLLRVERRGLGKTNLYYLPKVAAPRGRSAKMALPEMPKSTPPEVPNRHLEEYTDQEDSEQKDSVSNPSKFRKGTPSENRGRTVPAQPADTRPLSTTFVRVGEMLHNKANPPTHQQYRSASQMALETANAVVKEIHSTAEETPASNRTAARQSANPGTQTTRGRSRKPYPPERQRLLPYIEDFAREFNDQAALGTSVTRAYNDWQKSGLDLDAFTQVMYQARAITKEHSAAIQSQLAGRAGSFQPKKKMAYWFSTLEELLGLRELPEKRTAGAAPRLKHAVALVASPRRQIAKASSQQRMAGKYAHLVNTGLEQPE